MPERTQTELLGLAPATRWPICVQLGDQEEPRENRAPPVIRNLQIPAEVSRIRAGHRGGHWVTCQLRPGGDKAGWAGSGPGLLTSKGHMVYCPPRVC